jgi:hypothetical protein
MTALTPQTRMVLALLLVAALQKRRFAGGWITVEDLSQHTPIGDVPDNVRKALVRALAQLGGVREVRIEGKKLKKRSYVRLVSPVSTTLRDWLKSERSDWLLAGSWDDLVANAPALEGLHRAEIFGFMETLMGSAPARAKIPEWFHAFDEDEWCFIARLLLHRIEATLGDRYGGLKELAEAQNALEGHLDRDVKDPSHVHFLVEAQACIMIARSIMAHAMAEKPEWPLDERRVTECRAWLRRAEPAMLTVPSLDRGYALALEGLLCVHEGSLPPFPHPDLFDDAGKLFLQALQQFRLCMDVRGIPEVFRYQFERVYQCSITAPMPFSQIANRIAAQAAQARSLYDAIDCEDLRIILRARMVIFGIVVATHGATPSHTPAILEAFRAAGKELRDLRSLSTPMTAPFVAHADARLREYAKTFQVTGLMDLEGPKRRRKSRPRNNS